jgi:hypothetical protein
MQLSAIEKRDEAARGHSAPVLEVVVDHLLHRKSPLAQWTTRSAEVARRGSATGVAPVRMELASGAVAQQ